MPIFSEVVSFVVSRDQNLVEPITVFGGGKANIIDWSSKYSPQNASIILDMDFDEPSIELESDIITPLKRYSIENYFFDETVVAPLVAFLLSRNIADVSRNFSLSELKVHWSIELSELLPVLFYYQKIYQGDKNKWNSFFINRGDGQWQICAEKVTLLKSSLLVEMNISQEQCQLEFVRRYSNGTCPFVNFPGKILLESFHRYLKFICNGYKAGSYSTITNPKSLVSTLAGRLARNSELESIVIKALI